MNAAVVYFSRTGNTKKLAQAIAQVAQAQLFDMAATLPSTVEGFDLLILGTPVEGSCPTKEAMAYIANMPTVTGKKAILFVTYKMFGNERTMKAVEKALEGKGYQTILKVSKKGMKPEQTADFSKILEEVKAALPKL